MRPFVRKVSEYPVLACSQPQTSEDSIQQHQQQNVIILNLANPAQSSLKTDTASTTTPVNNNNNNNNMFSVCQQQRPLNLQPSSSVISLSASSNSYRVITNTLQTTNGSSVAKLPTRFRLINNGLNAINTNSLTPSVIKMNTLA